MSQINSPSKADSLARLLPKIQQRFRYSAWMTFKKGVKSNYTEHTLLKRHIDALLSH